MSKRIALHVSAAVAAAALASTAAALDRDDFVAGWAIEAPAGAEVFDVALTAEVYAAAENIGQIAVLDAQGEPQSFFRSSSPGSERRVGLDASPLYAAAAETGLVVGVTRGESGASVNVSADGPSPPVVTGFVLDGRELGGAPTALELEWRALPQPFLLDVVVEQSMDLTRWRRVGRASVAALSVGGTEARHTRVPVAASRDGYYRVTQSGAVPGWHLLRATFVIPTAEPPATASVRLQPLPEDAEPEDAEPGAFYFDAGGPLPVSSVTLAFGDDGGWARADVRASRSPTGPWVPVVSGELFYAVSFEGRELANEPVRSGSMEARYWRIQPRGAPPRNQPLELVLEFTQERLRVAARGAPPYLLAAGTLVEEAGPDATFEALWSRVERPEQPVAAATLAARQELGGPDVLVPRWQFPWRTASLWTVLIGGVLVVGAMAVRLAGEMRSREP